MHFFYNLYLQPARQLDTRLAEQISLRWCTIAGPCSWYSSFVIHNWWNVPKLESIDPPTHEAYFLSKGIVGEWILIFCYACQLCPPVAPDSTHTRHQRGKLHIETLNQASSERCVSNNDDILQQRASDIDVAGHDRVVDELMQRYEIFEGMRVRSILHRLQSRRRRDVLPRQRQSPLSA
jgi:hypothetical protein